MAAVIAPTAIRRTPRRRGLALTGVVLVTATLALTGCASCSSASSGRAVGLSDGAVGPQPAVGGELKAQDSTGSTAAGAPADQRAAAPLALTTTRAVVVTSDSSVRVSSVTKATDELGVLATRYSATIDSQVTSRGSNGGIPLPATKDQTVCPEGRCPQPYPPYGYESSTTTLRVDNDKVDSLLRDVATLGTVEASSRSSADVTAEVADVDVRVTNAEASLARVRALLARATSIGDIVTLEAELSRRQADLEALQARQRTLADQTAQATVTVRLFDEGAPMGRTEPDTGFVAGLTAGWAAFTDAFVAAMTVLGALVPFLIVLLPVALVIWVAVRRSRRVPPVVSPASAPVDVS